MKYKTALSPTLFEAESHARWSLFFTSLGVHWEYKVDTIKLPEVRTYTPTFTLPAYSGGLYVEVGAWAMGEADKPLLARLERPLWILPETPEAKVSYVYYLDEFENIQVTPVVPGFFHREKKFFTNPTQIDNRGYILRASLEKHGRPLQQAILLAKDGKVDAVEGNYKTYEDKRNTRGTLEKLMSPFVTYAHAPKKPAEPKAPTSRSTVYRIQAFVGDKLLPKVLDMEYYREGVFFDVDGTRVRIHIDTLRELLTALDKEIG